jgi:beta-galactosidase
MQSTTTSLNKLMLNKEPVDKTRFTITKHFYYILLQLLLLVFFISSSYAQEQINDYMFASKPSAKSSIDFDAKGFLINGKRTFLASAGVEYARMPHELWQDRLLRLKRGGFNCVEIYTLWNFHEPTEGQFEFSGDQNLDEFLTLVKTLGMYAIVRVGPYYCAEWDQGGYPIWLRFKPGLRVRENNAPFEKYVDRFFDHLLPVVFKHQINKGGAVILVQLENEHPKGWGTGMPDPYFKHLQSKALSLGLEVPYFFSGVHHASDPAGNGNLDDPGRPNPWFSTEFWSVWYDQYGPKPLDAPVYDRRTWKIIAHGGSGYNVYMAYGGSNFGYTNNDEDAATYDYGAAVGQSGDLRPVYYTFKRAAYFARSFEELLENSSDDSKSYQYLASDTTVKITARSSPAGTIVFLDNPGILAVTKTIKAVKNIPSLTFSLAAGEIYPLVHQVKISAQVMLDWAFSRIYGVVRQKKTTTLLVEALPGHQVKLYFKIQGKTTVSIGNKDLKRFGDQLILNTLFKAGPDPAEYVFNSGDQMVRILIMSRAALDKTWVAEEQGLKAIVTGVSYLAKVNVENQEISADAAYPLEAPKDNAGTMYLEKRSAKLLMTVKQSAGVDSVVHISNWAQKDATVYAALPFNDQSWKKSDDPLQMGADGDLAPSAWYRTKFIAPSSGKYTLQIEGGDRGTVFVDGKSVAKWRIKDFELTLNLIKGPHTLAFFTAHDGRDKMAAYLGPIHDLDKKGLSGVAMIKKGGPFIKNLENWYFKRAVDSLDLKKGPPVLDTAKATKYKIGTDAFALKEGYGWFQTIIPAVPSLSQLILQFKSTDEDATIFINGKEVLKHKGWNIPFELKISESETLNKPILVSVFIANLSNEGGIDQPVKINTIGSGTSLKGWKMNGGVYPDEPTAKWEALSIADSLKGPQFYRATFRLPEVKGQQLIWRVNTIALGHGSVWVNGHNLGRYPEKVGTIGMYIPEPWLKAGTNEILIYDEDGKYPDQVNVSVEKAASRIQYELTTNH